MCYYLYEIFSIPFFFSRFDYNVILLKYNFLIPGLDIVKFQLLKGLNNNQLYYYLINKNNFFMKFSNSPYLFNNNITWLSFYYFIIIFLLLVFFIFRFVLRFIFNVLMYILKLIFDIINLIYNMHMTTYNSQIQLQFILQESLDRVEKDFELVVKNKNLNEEIKVALLKYELSEDISIFSKKFKFLNLVK